MNKQTNRMLAPQDFWNAVNSKDPDYLASLLAGDYIFERAGFRSPRLDKSGFLEFIKKWWEAFPDGKITEVRDLTGGDTAVSEGIFEGTHEGDFMGITGTGKRVVYPFIEVFEFRGPKVKSVKAYGDTLTLIEQIGVMPRDLLNY